MQAPCRTNARVGQDRSESRTLYDARLPAARAAVAGEYSVTVDARLVVDFLERFGVHLRLVLLVDAGRRRTDGHFRRLEGGIDRAAVTLGLVELLFLRCLRASQKILNDYRVPLYGTPNQIGDIIVKELTRYLQLPRVIHRLIS